MTEAADRKKKRDFILNSTLLKSFACFALLLIDIGLAIRAQDTPCVFDDSSLSYTGTPQEQARCLLRPVLMGGHLGAPLKKLPAPLEKLIGKPVNVDKAALRRYLAERNINEADIGGSVDDPLVPANTNDPRAPLARYFVIHDTSTPNYLDKPVPPDINEVTWSLND